MKHTKHILALTLALVMACTLLVIPALAGVYEFGIQYDDGKPSLKLERYVEDFAKSQYFDVIYDVADENGTWLGQRGGTSPKKEYAKNIGNRPNDILSSDEWLTVSTFAQENANRFDITFTFQLVPKETYDENEWAEPTPIEVVISPSEDYKPEPDANGTRFDDSWYQAHFDENGTPIRDEDGGWYSPDGNYHDVSSSGTGFRIYKGVIEKMGTSKGSYLAALSDPELDYLMRYYYTIDELRELLSEEVFNRTMERLKSLGYEVPSTPLPTPVIDQPKPTPTPTPTPTTPDMSTDFEIDKDGKLTKYKGLGGNVVIPDGVTSIEGEALYNCINLTSVVIPNSVTKIGQLAFCDCKNLARVNIPDSVTVIEHQAFARCTGLTNVNIGSGVTSIGNSTFINCTSLTSVVIPDSVTTIGQGAFYYCKNLTSVTIPASVTSLGNAAFSQTGLTDVYYGGSEAQWKTITATSNYEPLLTAATIHYNSAAPAQPVQPTSTTAYASTQTVTVDGKPVTFYAYALKDANGNDTNYIKLRDVAHILNGSAAQFQVGWDGSITITTKTAYTPNGSEMVQNFTGNQSYTVSTSLVMVNGQPTNLEAITLTDASGGGYTYFKLRDLGQSVGFDVDWTAETGITVNTRK